MLVWAGFNIVVGILVPIGDRQFFPETPYTYMAQDAAFSGVPWADIMAASPDLGYWIAVPYMDIMCGRMLAGGILVGAIAIQGLRRGERWAYLGLALGTAVFWAGGIVISIPAWSVGLIETIPPMGAVTPPGTLLLLWLMAINLIAVVLADSHFRGRPLRLRV
jgi:hypothetical protein